MDGIVERAQAIARPRVGLLGNPSDSCGGRAISFLFAGFRARVDVERNLRGIPLTPDRRALVVDPARDPSELLRDEKMDGGARLLAAAWSRFRGYARAAGAELESDRIVLRFESDIPRQCGLAGSSAIVIAGLRALSRLFSVEIRPFDLSELALAAEVEDLGIAAGPQDRVIQSFGGLRFMDFRPPRDPSNYVALDPSGLPPMILVWPRTPGRPSGAVHAGVRERFERGEPEVVSAMRALSELADQGREAIERGDTESLLRAIDRNFDLRARLFCLPASECAEVEIGRRLGAAVKYPGSGGALLCATRDRAGRDRVRTAYEARGYETMDLEIVEGESP